MRARGDRHRRPGGPGRLGSLERLALAALAALAGACVHPPPPPLPPRPPPPPPAPVAVGDSACTRTVAGRLVSRDGALFFDARHPAEVSNARASGDEAHEEVDEAGEGRRRGGAALVLLGGLPGRFSTLVPDRAPRRLLAVRQGGGGDAPDALVRIDPARLRSTTLWSPGGRLRLLGRSGGRAVLLVEEGDGVRAAAVGPDGQALLSEPFTLPAELRLAGRPRPELGLPDAAPLGPDRLALRCEDGRLCLIQVAEDRVEVQRLVVRVDALALHRGDVLLRQGGRCIPTRKRAPEQWAQDRGLPCPVGAAFAPDDPGLPVDGAVSAPAPVQVDACLVRSEVELPPPSGPGAGREDDAAAGGAGLVLLPSPPAAGWLALDLLVRGRALAVGLTALDGAYEATLRRDFGVALPPGTVTATRVRADGRAMYHVRVRAPLPYDPSPACFRGRLVVRVVGGGDDDAEGAPEQAFANRSLALGRCP